MSSPNITAFKLKKNIWFYPAGTIFDYADGNWHVEQPNDPMGRMINETTLAAAIEGMVGYADEEEWPEEDDEYIEVLTGYKPTPPETLEYNGLTYRLETPNE